MPKPAAAWTPQALKELEDNYLDERSALWLYDSLAKLNGEADRRKWLSDLASYEEKHASRWHGLLKAAGREPPPGRPFLEHRLFVALSRLFGVGAVLPLMHKMEVDGIAKYRRQSKEWAAAADAFREILPDEIVHEIEIFGMMRRDTERGALRSAILGANDGLGSVLAISAGVAGGTGSSHAVLLAGVSALVAGAASMAASGYVSVKAEREVLETRVGLERDAAALAPGAKRKELADSLASRGLERSEADAAAERISRSPEAFVRALLEAQGLADQSLESPGRLAAYTSGAFLAAGAIPLIPFLFMPAAPALKASVALAAVALFGSGLLRSLATLKSFVRSGIEMVVVGLGSAALTYAIGRLIGGGVPG